MNFHATILNGTPADINLDTSSLTLENGTWVKRPPQVIKPSETVDIEATVDTAPVKGTLIYEVPGYNLAHGLIPNSAVTLGFMFDGQHTENSCRIVADPAETLPIGAGDGQFSIGIQGTHF